MKDGAIPKYKQLEKIILDSITKGELSAGDQISTEKELSTKYNISRITVRKALENLEKQGYLTRISGKGTFIADKVLLKDISNTLGFSENILLQGKKPGAKVIENKIIDSTPEIENALNLEKDEKVISVIRVRTANEEPISLEYSIFPMDYEYLLHEDLNDKSMYDILKKQSNIHFGNSRKTIKIVSSNFEESKYLKIPEGHSVLCLKSVVVDTNNNKIHISKQIILGDKFTLIV
ncbi:GntR family transcriptional regulator [Natronobacillus azotifigens]|uniref:GntR family transcriptional regulator n=1 Tax=Natronobacillus azotifigens TaxID=472978 RepID=A0A9J6RCK0_9BACI|nr:GntR family transcriptional regulator [Natronobacillus azotifigens]MCZ0703028.1 GntR family transcriptional regulator [Natronobacillus azotifigens]